VVLLAGIAPAVSHASTIVGSPLTLPNEGTIGAPGQVFVQTALPEPSTQLTSPVSGTVVQWSIRGTSIHIEPNTFKLRVLRPAGSGTFTGAGTSAQAETPHTGSNDDTIRHFATALPIRAADQIGLNTVEAEGAPTAKTAGVSNAVFEPFSDGSQSESPKIVGIYQEFELLFNAEVVAAPTSSATVPTCTEEGKVTVSMVTDPSTTPKAVLFRIDAGIQQVATAAAGTATVMVPGGQHTLEYWGEDGVPQQEIAHHTATLQVGGCSAAVITPSVPGAFFASRPVLSGASQTNRTWREGNGLARYARKAKPPIGTTFSFSLNQLATARLEFTQRASGRKAGRRCVAQTKHNSHKRRCTRTIRAGALSFAAHAGANTVRFQGRLSPTKKLKPGRYTLVITAAGASGQSAPQSLNFTIVKG
jgi:hypothetical protein